MRPRRLFLRPAALVCFQRGCCEPSDLDGGRVDERARLLLWAKVSGGRARACGATRWLTRWLTRRLTLPRGLGRRGRAGGSSQNTTLGHSYTYAQHHAQLNAPQGIFPEKMIGYAGFSGSDLGLSPFQTCTNFVAK